MARRTEPPLTVSTSRNDLQYFHNAGILTVKAFTWRSDGDSRAGRTATLDVTALLEADADDLQTARKVFVSILERIEARLSAT